MDGGILELYTSEMQFKYLKDHNLNVLHTQRPLKRFYKDASLFTTRNFYDYYKVRVLRDHPEALSFIPGKRK